MAIETVFELRADYSDVTALSLSLADSRVVEYEAEDLTGPVDASDDEHLAAALREHPAFKLVRGERAEQVAAASAAPAGEESAESDESGDESGE